MIYINADRFPLKDNYVYHYDEQNRLIKVVKNNELFQTVQYQTNEDNLSLVIETTFEKNSKSKTIIKGYNEKGLLVKESVGEDVIKHQYNDKDQIIKTTFQNGDFIEYNYTNDKLSGVYRYEKDKDDKIFVSGIKEFDSDGKLIKTKIYSKETGKHLDEINTIKYLYNEKGLLMSVDNVHKVALTEYFYDNNDHLRVEIYESPVKEGKGGPYETTYEYDFKGRLKREQTFTKDGDVTIIEYDYYFLNKKVRAKRVYVGTWSTL